MLVYGTNWFVDGASALAKRFRVSNIVIGLTIVALGTSTPELVVNVVAAVDNNTEIVLGNILGSNLINILIILGISSIIYPLNVQSNTTWVEIPLCFLASLVVLVMGNDVFLDQFSLNLLSRSEGVILIAFFTIFIGYSLHMLSTETLGDSLTTKDFSRGKIVLFIIFGLILSIAGGRLIVTGATGLARIMGIPERIIALTIVSLGTSLPELATSIIAVRKGNVDMAIGNVVGSNIFNIFFVLGISSIIRPVPVPESGIVDFFANILASLILFVFVFMGSGRKIGRLEGLFFVILYGVYLTTILTGI